MKKQSLIHLFISLLFLTSTSSSYLNGMFSNQPRFREINGLETHLNENVFGADDSNTERKNVFVFFDLDGLVINNGDAEEICNGSGSTKKENRLLRFLSSMSEKSSIVAITRGSNYKQNTKSLSQKIIHFLGVNIESLNNKLKKISEQEQIFNAGDNAKLLFSFYKYLLITGSDVEKLSMEVEIKNTQEFEHSNLELSEKSLPTCSKRNSPPKFEKTITEKIKLNLFGIVVFQFISYLFKKIEGLNNENTEFVFISSNETVFSEFKKVATVFQLINKSPIEYHSINLSLD